MADKPLALNRTSAQLIRNTIKTVDELAGKAEFTTAGRYNDGFVKCTAKDPDANGFYSGVLVRQVPSVTAGLITPLIAVRINWLGRRSTPTMGEVYRGRYTGGADGVGDPGVFTVAAGSIASQLRPGIIFEKRWLTYTEEPGTWPKRWTYRYELRDADPPFNQGGFTPSITFGVVVPNGPSTNQVMVLDIDATDGEFRFNAGGYLPVVGVTALAIQTELAAVSGTSVSVVSITATSFQCTFLDFLDHSDIEVDLSHALTPGDGGPRCYEAGYHNIDLTLATLYTTLLLVYDSPVVMEITKTQTGNDVDEPTIHSLILANCKHGGFFMEYDGTEAAAIYCEPDIADIAAKLGAVSTSVTYTGNGTEADPWILTCSDFEDHDITISRTYVRNNDTYYFFRNTDSQVLRITGGVANYAFGSSGGPWGVVYQSAIICTTTDPTGHTGSNVWVAIFSDDILEVPTGTYVEAHISDEQYGGDAGTLDLYFSAYQLPDPPPDTVDGGTW